MSAGGLQIAASAFADAQADANAKAVKILRDGKLLIIRDGKIYNVVGTTVR